MVPVWLTPSLVMFAKGDVRALATLWVSMLMLDDRIRWALFPSFVQRVEHPFGTRVLDYCPAHDSATEHVEDAQVHELRQGRHVQPAPAERSGGDVRSPQLVPAVGIGPPARHHLGRRPRFSPDARGATPPAPAHIDHACLVPSLQLAVGHAYQMCSVQQIPPDFTASVGAVPGWASVFAATAAGARRGCPSAHVPRVLIDSHRLFIPLGIPNASTHTTPYDIGETSGHHDRKRDYCSGSNPMLRLRDCSRLPVGRGTILEANS